MWAGANREHSWHKLLFKSFLISHSTVAVHAPLAALRDWWHRILLGRRNGGCKHLLQDSTDCWATAVWSHVKRPCPNGVPLCQGDVSRCTKGVLINVFQTLTNWQKVWLGTQGNQERWNTFFFTVKGNKQQSPQLPPCSDGFLHSSLCLVHPDLHRT